MPSNELSTSITEFLASSRIPKVRHCHTCGSLMEHVPAIFHFAGESWDIPLPVCPTCEPVPWPHASTRYIA